MLNERRQLAEREREKETEPDPKSDLQSLPIYPYIGCNIMKLSLGPLIHSVEQHLRYSPPQKKYIFKSTIRLLTKVPAHAAVFG